MSGQAAGLVLVALLGPYAAAQTILGWCEKRREQRRSDYVLDRDGR